MNTSTIIRTATFALLIAAVPCEAQQRWAFEGRAGAAFPTEDLGADALSTGVAFDGTIRYRFMPHLAAYAGWDWVHYLADDSFAGSDIDFEETGYAFGLRYQHPFSGEAGPGPAFWIRGGATYDHIELENDAGDTVADSGHGFGWEAGAGLAFDVGTRWSVTPGVRYRSLTRDIDVGTASAQVDLRYITAGVGMAIRF
jgi:opacity protein-like surface antigen